MSIYGLNSDVGTGTYTFDTDPNIRTVTPLVVANPINVNSLNLDVQFAAGDTFNLAVLDSNLDVVLSAPVAVTGDGRQTITTGDLGSLPAGTYYIVTSNPSTNGSVFLRRIANTAASRFSSTTPLNGTLVDPFVDGADFDYDLLFWMDYTESSASVTQADTTPEDGVQQSITSSGLTVAYTAATVGGYSILSGLSNTDPETASTYTLDIYSTSTPTALPRLLDDVTLSVTATGGTAEQTLNIQPQTGTSAIKLTSVTASSFVTLLANAGITLAIGDIINWDSSNNASISAAAVYTSDLSEAGQFTRMIVQQGGSATTTATTTSFKYYPFGEGGNDTSGNRKKRRRTMIRNFTYYKEKWEKFSD